MRRIYAIAGVLALGLLSAPTSGRRNRESPADSDDASGGPSGQRQLVPPTYIDTLNRGRELCLAKGDFNAIAPPAQGEPQDDGTKPSPQQASPVQGTAEGFRIQCVASSSIETVRAYKKEIESKLKYPAYIVFAEPYYKLHIGDFASRQAAESALVRVKEGGYREAWIVRSPISSGQPERR